MNRQLISLEQLDSDFPMALKTLYNGKSAGKYHWLTSIRPDGQPGRRLWIDVDAFNEWAQLQGMRFRLQLPTSPASGAIESRPFARPFLSSPASGASFHGGGQR